MDKIEKIIWTHDGIESLESVISFIAKDSEYYAGDFAKKVLLRIEKLADFPMIGRIVPEYQNPNLRELIYQNYRIVYMISPKAIYIVLVIHGSHNLPADIKTIR